MKYITEICSGPYWGGYNASRTLTRSLSQEPPPLLLAIEASSFGHFSHIPLCSGSATVRHCSKSL